VTVELRRPLTLEEGSLDLADGGEPPRRFPNGRICERAGCGTRLSTYNPDSACALHYEMPCDEMLVPNAVGGLMVAREPGSEHDDLPVGYTGDEVVSLRDASAILGYSVTGVRSRVETRRVPPVGEKREGTRGGRARTYRLRDVADAFTAPSAEPPKPGRRKILPREVAALAQDLLGRSDLVTLTDAAPLFGYAGAAALSRRLIWYGSIAPAPVGRPVGVGGPTRLYRVCDLARFLLDSFDAPAPPKAA
jgi:hypothetical protein